MNTIPTNVKEGVEDLMKRRFIVAPSFEIYPDHPAGLYDYGPVGCAIKNNFIAIWRQHFVLHEDMLEIDCSAVTPEPVLMASGHLERFNDFMVKDVKTSKFDRADHLLADHMEKLLKDTNLDPTLAVEYQRVRDHAGDMTLEELVATFAKYKIKSRNNNDLMPPAHCNLMFKTAIGPDSRVPGYLRPETAQGIFVNFKRLLDFNGGKLPFAAAQVGNAYRNEIAPRSGLTRVREFTMAEIEYFVHPDRKFHPKFSSVANIQLNLLTAQSQEANSEIITISIGQAARDNIIANETLAYFLGRTYQFLIKVGIKPEKLRFRQHKINERAHYATDCWDADILISNGWLECVGHADRGCYDLSRHSEFSNANLQFYEEFKDGPKIVKRMKATINKPLLGSAFKTDHKQVIQYLENLSYDAAKSLQDLLDTNETVSIGHFKVPLERNMVKFNAVEEKISDITPHVIEPSFGIGRIIYALLEHSYVVREVIKREKKQDEIRAYLSLPPIIAPSKVSILPLVQSDELTQFTDRIVKILKKEGISSKVDDTGHRIGHRYSRNDEIGIPFSITIDFDTVKDHTVTIRERDSTQQVRIPISEVGVVLRDLSDHTIVWDDIRRDRKQRSFVQQNLFRSLVYITTVAVPLVAIFLITRK